MGFSGNGIGNLVEIGRAHFELHRGGAQLAERRFDRALELLDGHRDRVAALLLGKARFRLFHRELFALNHVVAEPDDGARPVVRLEQGVIATLDTCEASWCRLSVGGYDGWIKRDVIWGVYPNEEFKD